MPDPGAPTEPTLDPKGLEGPHTLPQYKWVTGQGWDPGTWQPLNQVNLVSDMKAASFALGQHPTPGRPSKRPQQQDPSNKTLARDPSNKTPATRPQQQDPSNRPQQQETTKKTPSIYEEHDPYTQ